MIKRTIGEEIPELMMEKNLSWHAVCRSLGRVERGSKLKMVESDLPTEAYGYREMSKLLEVQRDVSKITGLTFFVTDPGVGYQPMSQEENPICRMLQEQPGGCERCERDCGQAILQASQKNEIMYYKCYGHLNNVAIPIRFMQGGEEKRFVVVGGRTFFGYQDFSSYRERLREMGGDVYKLLEMSKSLVFKEKAFLEDSARLIGRLASSTVEQMAHTEDLKDKVARLMTLSHVSGEIGVQVESAKIYQTILSTIGVLFNCQTVLFLVGLRDTDRYKTAGVFGRHSDLLRSYQVERTDAMVQRLISEHRMVFSTDGYEILKAGLPEDTLSLCLFPIGRGKGVDGILLLLNTTLSEEAEVEVAGFCNHIALSVENRLLHEERESRVENLSFLTGVLESIASSIDSEEIYSVILDKAAAMTGASQGSLMILNEEASELEIKATRGISRSILQYLRVKAGDGIAGTVLKTGVPLVVNDVEEDRRVRKANRPRYRGKSFLSLPLKIGGKVIGVINLSDKEGGAPFRDEEVNALTTLALYASIAMERFRYYQSSINLRRISITDPLSGLLNRRYFEERLAEEVERSKRYGESFSLIILDIDNFKQFNDSFGHPIGDEALRSTSTGIRRCIRTIDIAARYGGEEFAVILPQAKKEDARAIGERIRQEIEDGWIKIPELEQRVRLTVSIGIAEYPDAVTHYEDLIRNADRALYRAKALGKNRVVLFGEM